MAKADKQLSARDTVKTIDELKKEAGIPVQIDRERLATMGVVTWLTKEATQARNPSSGELGDGYLVTIETDDGTQYTSFIANMLLVRDLDRIDLPFRAKLVLKGRTWQFAS